MRFSMIHKLSSYLMTLTAVAAVALGPDLSLVATALTLVGVGLSWFAEPARLRLERYTAAWNIATVIFFFYLVTEVVRGEPVITAGAHFLLFVLVNKLFNRRTSRDYLQAYVVTFLLLVVATTMNNGISYAVCFAGYVLFATWTMTLFHLRREMEENYLLKHSEGAQSEKVEVERILNSRRIVGGSFLAGTSIVSLGIIVGAAAFFLLFPRIGFGLFVSQKRGGVAMVGFRDRVELGFHGVVRDNPTVVMRVVPAGGHRPGALRWRGSAFDRYEQGTWSHRPQMLGEHERVSPIDGMYLLNVAPGFLETSPAVVRERLLRQEIYLEPLDSTVLFAADRPVAIELPRRGMLEPRRGPFAEIHASKLRTAGVHYVAYSQILSPSPAVLRQSPSVLDPRLRDQLPRIESYLQLPRDLPPRISELARRITAGQPTVLDQVLAVQDFLRRSYTYTLRLTHDRRREPVDEFLFVTRRGHCEYFASAMALLLRAVGIPTRSVNGFAGGEWNDFGRYLAVRQGDAHTWVEVLFSGVGWVSFDPTPGGQTPAGSAGVVGTMRQLLDTLRLRWFRYVVEYDLRQQVSLVRRVQEALRSPRVSHGLSVARQLALVGAAAAVALALAVWLWRRRRGGDGPPLRRRTTSRLSGTSQLYARLLAMLARAGHRTPASTTAQELAEELDQRGWPAAQLVQRFVRCYYEARFGGRAPDGELARLLREVRHEIRKHAGGAKGAGGAGGKGDAAAVSR